MKSDGVYTVWWVMFIWTLSTVLSPQNMPSSHLHMYSKMITCSLKESLDFVNSIQVYSLFKVHTDLLLWTIKNAESSHIFDRFTYILCVYVPEYIWISVLFIHWWKYLFMKNTTTLTVEWLFWSWMKCSSSLSNCSFSFSAWRHLKQYYFPITPTLT